MADLFTKKHHIYLMEKDKLSKLGPDDYRGSLLGYTRRLETDINNNAHNLLVNMFQDFVLEFNRIPFTDGRKKMLLFTVLKAEGDIFQELREYDRAIRAYKSLKNFCDIWQLKYPSMMVAEQIGMSYRLMRMHSVAVDYFKKQLCLSWEIESERDELLAYMNIA